MDSAWAEAWSSRSGERRAHDRARIAAAEKAASLAGIDEFGAAAAARRLDGAKAGRLPGFAGSLPRAVRDPRAVAEIRRRSLRAATRGSGIRHRTLGGRHCAQPHPDFLSPGAPEVARKGERLQ